mmetsp:Transcript_81318/g.94801  ORF Transcript_81318/g.94801 Transcript_81318/m.94801 type:complete len:137 (+) Transcript_81318:1-411(+)
MNESSGGKNTGSLGKQEKIILEALSNRVNELESENYRSSQKIKALQEQIIEKDQAINLKTKVINSISSELASKLPSAEALVNSLDKDDIEELKSLSNKSLQEVQNIAEKILLENIRLKGDLTLLGQEMNNLIRSRK